MGTDPNSNHRLKERGDRPPLIQNPKSKIQNPNLVAVDLDATGADMHQVSDETLERYATGTIAQIQEIQSLKPNKRERSPNRSRN
ncbi:MAG: hypothetical protein ACFB8W_08070 [Elainellaceae cyanobacterium]